MKLCKALIFLFVIFQVAAHAQLCTGSLGDPVTLITFDTGANPGPPLPAGVTNYNYSANSCPNEGEYTIANRTFDCFDNTWVTVVADHTSGDLHGYFMLVNSSSTAGILYKNTVNGLCPNTTYEFSAWIINMLKASACNGNGIEPNFTFTIETTSGILLASYSTGDIPNSTEITASWIHYGTFFKTPENTSSVILSIENNAPGGCGNDIALDDITVRPCGPVVKAIVNENGQNYIEVCEGDASTFILETFVSTGFDTPEYQWQKSSTGVSWTDIPGANDSLYTAKPPITSGIYYFRVGVAEAGNITSVNCRIYSSTITITYNARPYVQITNYVYGCVGGTVVLFAAGGSVYDWSGPNGFHSSEEGPVISDVQFIDSGRYYVKITTEKGCSDTTSIYLYVFPAIHATFGEGGTICEGGSITLTAGGGARYKWYPPNNLSNDSIANPIARPTDTTIFIAIAFNQYGCSDTGYVAVNVWKKPVANAGEDKRTRIGVPVILDGEVSGTDVDYYWTPSLYINDVNLLHPIVNPQKSVTYLLHAVSRHGCEEMTDSVYIKVYEQVLIPNAFSPNGDGINDTWLIEPLDLFNDAILEVFNRYGQIVYINKGAYNKPWNGTQNGKLLPIGTYYYILDLRLKNEKPITGSVTIVR